MKPTQKARIAIIMIGLVALLGASGFAAWGSNPARPMPQALTALQTDTEVRVAAESGWIAFTPGREQPTTGLVFYPGGRVDYRAYAPAARQIAHHGYLVVIVRMPLNLAVFDPGAAADVIAAYPQVKHWVVGGHSLGGAMAANYASSNPVDGLVLWAAYPAFGDDLSGSGLPVASIYGTLDGLATAEKIDASRALLPAEAVFTAIEGGNHAQFGWYGVQAGDNPAQISHPDQQAQVVAATVALLENLR